MIPSRKLLMLGGLSLALLGMLYGLYFALYVEHQTLEQLGGALAQSFSTAAARDFPSSQAALHRYGDTKYDYVRQVDAHSHWVGLAILLILLAPLFDRVNFSERARQAIALCLIVGSVVFPLSVILQTFQHGSPVFKGLAVGGSGLVIVGLAATAWGFARQREFA